MILFGTTDGLAVKVSIADSGSYESEIGQFANGQKVSCLGILQEKVIATTSTGNVMLSCASTPLQFFTMPQSSQDQVREESKEENK